MSQCDISSPGSSGSTSRGERLAARLAALLEAHRFALLALFSVCYFGVVLLLASRKLFWYDELFTWHIAQMPSVADMRHALDQGMELHPLPFFLVTRLGLALVDNDHIGMRLPEMVGVWTAAVCVFLFVARRTNALYGTMAIMTLLLTRAMRYAYEGRPYGLALGFVGLSLYAWQRATEEGRRTIWLVVLALAIAGIVSSSFYAILAVFALVAGEAVRTWSRKKIDWGVWGAMATGLASILFYLPDLLRGMSRFSEGSWASPYKMVVFDMYRSLFGDFTLILVPLVAVVPLVLAFRSPRPFQPDGTAGRLVPREIVAAVALLALPVVGYLAAELAVEAITARYVLPATIGFSILLPLAAFRLARGSALFATAYVAVAAVAFAATGVAFEYSSLGRAHLAVPRLRKLLAEQPADLPVAILDPIPALVLMHYEEPENAKRLVYILPRRDPMPPQELAAWREHSTWLKMREVFPVQVEELPIFREEHPRFLLYRSGPESDTGIRKVIESGTRMELVAVEGSDRLYLVEPAR